MPFISVIVAARNEAEYIDSCLDALLGNDYPSDCFEIIVIDDGSEDETAARVQNKLQPVLVGDWQEQSSKNPHLRLISLPIHDAGGTKGLAQQHGMAAARGDILLTTDADCTVSPQWIRTMAKSFRPETGFVAGPVRYRPGPTLFGKLQALEFLGLVATGAGGMGLGKPNMCNSANVGYRREVLDLFPATDEQRLLPGYDEMLAQRLSAETDWCVAFCADPDAMVETVPELDVRAFWSQRRRWAGTGPRYPRPWLVATILGVYAFYVLLLGSLLALVIVPTLWPAVLGALMLKLSAEASLLYPACAHFGQRDLFRYFGLAQGVQIPYVVAIGVAAAIAPPSWKGQTTIWQDSYD